MPEVLYLDDELCAVHKPAGLLVHRRSNGRDQHAPALLQLIRDQLDQSVFTIHRLDRGTSGIVLFARVREAAQELSRQFREGLIEKHYLALVRGFVAEPLLLNDPLKPRRTESDSIREPRAATTVIHPQQQFEIPVRSDRYPTTRCSLVEACPHTGRWHQIRRHLNHVSHPVIGDTTHGDSRQNRFFREHCAIRRLMLAAVRLRFCHPRTGQPMTVSCDPDESFRDAVSRLQPWAVARQPFLDHSSDR